MPPECGRECTRGAAHRAPSALKLEFADGQRIIINHDGRTHKIWLAARSGGIEYAYNGSNWLSQPDGSELFAKLAELFHQHITSDPPHRLWARRSLFYLHGALLLVTEVFCRGFCC